MIMMMTPPPLLPTITLVIRVSHHRQLAAATAQTYIHSSFSAHTVHIDRSCCVVRRAIFNSQVSLHFGVCRPPAPIAKCPTVCDRVCARGHLLAQKPTQIPRFQCSRLWTKIFSSIEDFPKVQKEKRYLEAAQESQSARE